MWCRGKQLNQEDHIWCVYHVPFPFRCKTALLPKVAWVDSANARKNCSPQKEVRQKGDASFPIKWAPSLSLLNLFVFSVKLLHLKVDWDEQRTSGVTDRDGSDMVSSKLILQMDIKNQLQCICWPGHGSCRIDTWATSTNGNGKSVVCNHLRQLLWYLDLLELNCLRT